MWLSRLDEEVGNLRAAMRTFVGHAGAEGELRLAAALYRYWFSRGYWSEARRWLEEGLARQEEVVPCVRAKALWSLGSLAVFQGDVVEAGTLLRESIDVYRELDDRRGSARALNALGLAVAHAGQYEKATSLLEESLDLSRQLEDSERGAVALSNLGFVAAEQGDLVRAKTRYDEALAIFRAAGNTGAIAETLHSLGEIALYAGNLDEAEARTVESLALFQELGTRHHAATLAVVAWRRGQYERAVTLLRESLQLAHKMGERKLTLGLLRALAAVAAAQAEPERAARLEGAEAALRKSLSLPVAPSDQAEGEETLARAKEALGEEDFTHAWDEGRAMTLEEAIAYALAEEPAR